MMYRYLNDEQRAWVVETYSFCWDDSYELTARCAELSDELCAFKIISKNDPNFSSKLNEWVDFIEENHIMVALEQCCHEGILLSKEMQHLRLKTCPKIFRIPLDNVLNHCPIHVLHHLALRYFLIVRMERHDRCGRPEWSPSMGPFYFMEDLVYTPRNSFKARRYVN